MHPTTIERNAFWDMESDLDGGAARVAPRPGMDALVNEIRKAARRPQKAVERRDPPPPQLPLNDGLSLFQQAGVVWVMFEGRIVAKARAGRVWVARGIPEDMKGAIDRRLKQPHDANA